MISGITFFAVALLFALAFLTKWTGRRHPRPGSAFNSDSARRQSSSAEPPCLPRASQ
jgi:hypothetical protein